jgi:hypothetical protein
MADPVAIDLSPGVWTLVAEDVTSGNIEIIGYQPDSYKKDYRVTGSPVPTDPNETQRDVRNRFIGITSYYPIDVYLKFTGRTASDIQQSRVVVSL